MPKQAQLLRALVDLADTLVADFDLAGLSGLFRDEALFAQVNAGFRSVGL